MTNTAKNNINPSFLTEKRVHAHSPVVYLKTWTVGHSFFQDKKTAAMFVKKNKEHEYP